MTKITLARDRVIHTADGDQGVLGVRNVEERRRFKERWEHREFVQRGSLVRLTSTPCAVLCCAEQQQHLSYENELSTEYVSVRSPVSIPLVMHLMTV